MGRLRVGRVILAIIISIILITTLIYLLNTSSNSQYENIKEELNETSENTTEELSYIEYKGRINEYIKNSFFYSKSCKAFVQKNISLCNQLEDDSDISACEEFFSDTREISKIANNKCNSFKEQKRKEFCRAINKGCDKVEISEKNWNKICKKINQLDYDSCTNGLYGNTKTDKSKCIREISLLEALKTDSSNKCKAKNSTLIDKWYCQAITQEKCNILSKKYKNNFAPFMYASSNKNKDFCKRITNTDLRSKCVNENMTKEQVLDIFW